MKLNLASHIPAVFPTDWLVMDFLYPADSDKYKFIHLHAFIRNDKTVKPWAGVINKFVWIFLIIDIGFTLEFSAGFVHLSLTELSWVCFTSYLLVLIFISRIEYCKILHKCNFIGKLEFCLMVKEGYFVHYIGGYK